MAEYHEQKPLDDRGIKADDLIHSLEKGGFIDIKADYHRHGKHFRQLDREDKILLKFESFISGYPKEQFMENIQITAIRGECQ